MRQNPPEINQPRRHRKVHRVSHQPPPRTCLILLRVVNHHDHHHQPPQQINRRLPLPAHYFVRPVKKWSATVAVRGAPGTFPARAANRLAVGYSRSNALSNCSRSSSRFPSF